MTHYYQLYYHDRKLSGNDSKRHYEYAVYGPPTIIWWLTAIISKGDPAFSLFL